MNNYKAATRQIKQTEHKLRHKSPSPTYKIGDVIYAKIVKPIKFQKKEGHIGIITAIRHKPLITGAVPVSIVNPSSSPLSTQPFPLSASISLPPVPPPTVPSQVTLPPTSNTFHTSEYHILFPKHKAGWFSKSNIKAIPPIEIKFNQISYHPLQLNLPPNTTLAQYLESLKQHVQLETKSKKPRKSTVSTQ